MIELFIGDVITTWFQVVIHVREFNLMDSLRGEKENGVLEIICIFSSEKENVTMHHNSSRVLCGLEADLMIQDHKHKHAK